MSENVGPTSGFLVRNRTIAESTTDDNGPLATTTLSELLHKQHQDHKEVAKRALFSTFDRDFQWLSDSMPTGVPYIVVTKISGGRPFCPYVLENYPNMTVIVPVERENQRIFHAKICLITFEQHLRLVVSSANLTPTEWEKMHNIIWYQDFPRLPDDQPSVRCEFFRDLRAIFDFWGVPFRPFRRYDFSITSARLVFSVPGNHSLPLANSLGHLRLRSLTQELYEKTNRKPVTIISQSSAVGSLRLAWLREWLTSLQGAPEPPCELKVVYPSEQTVDGSEYPEAAGHLNLPRPPRHVRKESEEYLYPWKPAANLPRYLPHSKVICGLSEEGVPMWMYVGSHNFTQSAWGLWKSNTLQIKNYEVGVWFASPPEPSGWALPFEWGHRPFARTFPTPYYTNSF